MPRGVVSPIPFTLVTVVTLGNNRYHVPSTEDIIKRWLRQGRIDRAQWLELYGALQTVKAYSRTARPQMWCPVVQRKIGMEAWFMNHATQVF